MIDYRAARLNMVEGQLRTNKVTDAALLAAFLAVPRERFVPPALRGAAYVDEDLPLGGGRYLMEPRVLGRLLQLAAVAPNERVLEIGAATGYGTALLSRLAAQVVAVESEARFIAPLRTALAELGAANVVIVEGDLAAGHAERAPYDVIVIEGAVGQIPERLARCLGEGGRLVTVLKPDSGMGQGVLTTRIGGVLSHRPAFDAGTPLLPGFAPAPSFVF